jgi:hypothetical protein
MMPQNTTPILIIIPPSSHPFMSHALREKEKRPTTIFFPHTSMETPSSLFCPKLNYYKLLGNILPHLDLFI